MSSPTRITTMTSTTSTILRLVDMNPAKLSSDLFSHPFNKTIDHALLAGAVELDRQLVAVDRGDVAVAEFLMKDAVAEGKRRHRAGRFGDQLAFDGERHALCLLAAQRRIAPQ